MRKIGFRKNRENFWARANVVRNLRTTLREHCGSAAYHVVYRVAYIAASERPTSRLSAEIRPAIRVRENRPEAGFSTAARKDSI